MKKTSEWFENWFDSPYYHVLYKHRNHQEAKAFINKLVLHLAPAPAAVFLDKACGRGRHTAHLAKKGYKATGLDLSPNNIAYAQQKWSTIAQFEIHDMRLPYRSAAYDYVLSLFTSFGYFETDKENEQVLASAYSDLKSGGTMVLDFLNINWVKEHLQDNDIKTIKDIQFCQKRQITDGWIIKNIDITDGEEKLHFEEKVKALNIVVLKQMFENVGFSITALFGNYNLDSFDAELSERIIIIATKP
jgi:SAM-dependent methyltransferase